MEIDTQKLPRRGDHVEVARRVLSQQGFSGNLHHGNIFVTGFYGEVFAHKGIYRDADYLHCVNDHGLPSNGEMIHEFLIFIEDDKVSHVVRREQRASKWPQQQHLHFGDHVQVARRALTEQGYSCSVHHGDIFVAGLYGENLAHKGTYKDADYLHCVNDHVSLPGSGNMVEVHELVVFIEDNKVSGIVRSVRERWL
jgi:hypothetical protein